MTSREAGCTLKFTRIFQRHSRFQKDATLDASIVWTSTGDRIGEQCLIIRKHNALDANVVCVFYLELEKEKMDKQFQFSIRIEGNLNDPFF